MTYKNWNFHSYSHQLIPAHWDFQWPKKMFNLLFWIFLVCFPSFARNYLAFWKFFCSSLPYFYTCPGVYLHSYVKNVPYIYLLWQSLIGKYGQYHSKTQAEAMTSFLFATISGSNEPKTISSIAKIKILSNSTVWDKFQLSVSDRQIYGDDLESQAIVQDILKSMAHVPFDAITQKEGG